MATPLPETLAITCPGCGARFQVAGAMAGRKGRCAQCDAVFRVPGGTPAIPPKPVQPAAAPQYVPLHCRVCQTLMYGRLDQVGQPLKCPDCGGQTIVPKPQPVKPAKPLSAMEGEQYELWGVDEAPSVAAMLAAQPKYIAVVCRMCQTLMHATEAQVGKRLKCPDCGTLSVVPPPEEPMHRPVAASDEYELEIDPTLDPGDRPQVIVPPRRPMLYEEEAEAARKQQQERDARGERRGPQYDERGRAVMPRWPLATRVVSFLFTPGVVARWAALTLTWYLLVGPTWLASLTSMGPIAAVPMGIMSIICLMIWSAALAAIVMAIIVESSEGSDEVEKWPTTNPTDWFGEFCYLLFACLAAPLPGWLVGRAVPDPITQGILFVASVVVCLPVAILSQLDVGSAFAIASPRVIASFARVPGTWLMFYSEMAVLMAACVGVTIFAALLQPFLVALLVPMYIAAILLAARILGRLAWKLAESMPVSDE
jgi:DNA-directed RNA polymerase subunit M/transcription elongation factor TFIIS